MKDERARILVYTISFSVIGFLAVVVRWFLPNEATIVIWAALAVAGFQVFKVAREWRRKSAFLTDSKKHPWHFNKEIRSRDDLWMEIPERDHRKGQKPKVKIANMDELVPRVAFDIKNDSDGNITIRYPENQFFGTIGPPAFLKLEITGE